MASSVAGSVAKRLGKIEAEIKGAQRASVNAAALHMKRAVEHEIRRVAPGMRMGKLGKLGVGYDIKGSNNPTALLRARGPLHLLENDTKAHPIYRRGAAAKGRGARRINQERRLNQAFGGVGAYNQGMLRLPDGGFRAVVNHPGTKGKKPFAKGIKRGRPGALKALRDENVNALKRGFL